MTSSQPSFTQATKTDESPTAQLLGKLIMILNHQASGFLEEIRRATILQPEILESPEFLKVFPDIMDGVERIDGLSQALNYSYWLHHNLSLEENRSEQKSALLDAVFKYRRNMVDRIDADTDIKNKYDLAKWVWERSENSDEKIKLKQLLTDLIEPYREKHGLASGRGVALWVAYYIEEHNNETAKTANTRAAQLFQKYDAELREIETHIGSAKPQTAAEFQDALARHAHHAIAPENPPAPD